MLKKIEICSFRIVWRQSEHHLLMKIMRFDLKKQNRHLMNLVVRLFFSTPVQQEKTSELSSYHDSYITQQQWINNNKTSSCICQTDGIILIIHKGVYEMTKFENTWSVLEPRAGSCFHICAAWPPHSCSATTHRRQQVIHGDRDLREDMGRTRWWGGGTHRQEHHQQKVDLFYVCVQVEHPAGCAALHGRRERGSKELPELGENGGPGRGALCGGHGGLHCVPTHQQHL